MASGVSIAVASETREYAQGIQRGVIEPTEDAEEALQRLGRDDAGEELQQSMRTAQRGTEELRQDIDRLSTQVREGGRAGRNYGTDMKSGMRQADEGVETAAENTKSNLKEVAASFDGTVTGAVSGVQGLAAEILEGFGPGGLIAGAVLAGGIGLLLTNIENGEQQTEEFRASVSALAQTWIEAGKAGSLSAGEIVDQLKGLATQTDQNKASLADVEQQAKTLGVPFKELARVYAEGGDATQYAIDKTNRLIDSEQQLNLKRREQAGQTATLLDLGSARVRDLERQRDKLVAVQKETTEAAKREQQWLEAGGPDLEQKADATQNYADSVQSALVDAGSSWDDYKGKEGGLSLEKYLKITKQKIAAVEDYEANIRTIAQKGNQDALNYIESLGTDAAPLLEKFVKAPADKQDELIDVWGRLGKAASKSYAGQLQDGVPDTIPGPKVAPPDLNDYIAGVRSVRQAGQDYLNNFPLSVSFAKATRPGKDVLKP